LNQGWRELEKALNARAWECEEGVLALQAAVNGVAEEHQRRGGVRAA